MSCAPTEKAWGGCWSDRSATAYMPVPRDAGRTERGPTPTSSLTDRPLVVGPGDPLDPVSQPLQGGALLRGEIRGAEREVLLLQAGSRRVRLLDVGEPGER